MEENLHYVRPPPPTETDSVAERERLDDDISVRLKRRGQARMNPESGCGISRSIGPRLPVTTKSVCSDPWNDDDGDGIDRSNEGYHTAAQLIKTRPTPLNRQ
jgi:hypothetical protein